MGKTQQNIHQLLEQSLPLHLLPSTLLPSHTSVHHPLQHKHKQSKCLPAPSTFLSPTLSPWLLSTTSPTTSTWKTLLAPCPPTLASCMSTPRSSSALLPAP